MSKTIDVLYLAGGGHSGSTLISSFLGMHSNFFSGSEVCYTLYDLSARRDDFCSCGTTINDCEFWGDVLEIWQKSSPISVEKYIELQKCYERFIFLFTPFKNKHFKSDDFQNFSQATALLFEIMSEKSKNSWIIDASKNPARAYILNKMEFINLRTIHLVRDGRSLVYSLFKKLSHKKTLLHTVFFWVMVHMMSEMFLRKTTIKYEDFCCDPKRFLSKIEISTKEDMSELLALMKSDTSVIFDHTINGNRIRGKKDVKVKFNQDWEKNLPKIKKLISTIFMFPLLWRYGYLKK